MSKSKADELINFIINAFVILIIAGICIYASYHIIKTLAGDLPAWFGGILIGLLIAYVIAVNTRIKNFFKR